MEYDIKLKDNAKPYHGKAFPVPKAYEQALRTEVERICKIDVLLYSDILRVKIG